MDNLLITMQAWRNGELSDVEVLYLLAEHFPPSPVTDAAIEVIGKMYQEEVAEWERPEGEREELTRIVHDETADDYTKFVTNR